MRNFSIESGCALLLTDRITRKYACGVDIAEGFLVIGNESVAFTDARYFYAAKKTLKEVGIDCRLYKDLNDIKVFLNKTGVKKLFIDFDRTTVKEYEEYKSFGLDVFDYSSVIEKVVSVKSENEVISIKKACQIIQKAYHSAIKQVRKGMTETELRDIIEGLALDYGADGIAFDTIVAFGENSAVPHHQTGCDKLTDDCVILVDVGCTVNGFCSDLTRTAFFGKPTQKFIDCYGAVLKANLIAEKNIISGVNGKDADAYARDFLKSNGLDKNFTHSLGHGVGLEIHEYPRLSPKSDAPLVDGTVFTVEPGVYFDGEFGIRIEDTVILENGKLKRLFDDDKELLIL